MKFFLVVIALLFISCGTDNDNENNTKKHEITPKFIDSPIAGLNYECDGKNKITSDKGLYNCELTPIIFKIGKLKIGTISKFTPDKLIFIQDLFNLPRDNFTDPRVIALARLLQSLDNDGNIDEIILIPEEISSKFDTEEDFNPDEVDNYATKAGVVLVSIDEASLHLKRTYSRFKLFGDFYIPLNGGLEGEYWAEWCEFDNNGEGGTLLRYWNLKESGDGESKGNKNENIYTPLTYSFNIFMDLKFHRLGPDEVKTFPWVDFAHNALIFSDPDGQYLILHYSESDAKDATKKHLEESNCLAD